MKKRSDRDSIEHAIQGIIHCVHNDRHLKMELIAAALAIFSGVLLRINRIELIIIIIISFIIPTLEFVNTAVEKLLDRLVPFKDEETALIKDAVAGAVLSMIILSLIIACFILIPPLLRALF